VSTPGATGGDNPRVSDAAVRVRVAVCICEGDRILLAEHVKHGHRHWLLPGGGVEAGETLVDAAARELLEETGLEVEVGRLVLVCEAIEPGSRHLLNMVFAATAPPGELRIGRDGVLDDVAWHHRDDLLTLELHPPIGPAILECWAEGFAGPVRVLGNVWRPAGGDESAPESGQAR
jgi:ADP-ribose pyrophosphatase YjhB (NUDIX family)